MAEALQLTRNQLKAFLHDFKSIKQFENLFANVANQGDVYLRLDGTNGPMTGQLEIEGSEDEVQLVVRGNNPQTKDIFQIYDSAGALLYSISASGTVKTTGGEIGAIITEVSDYSMTTNNASIVADGSSNPVTVLFPASPEKGQEFHVACIDSTNLVQIDFNGQDLYKDPANFPLEEEESLFLKYSGAYWVEKS